MKRLCQILALGLLAVGIPDRLAAQQGTIMGQVVDETTRQPLPDVQIVVEGTTRGTLTNAQGRYQLVGIPVGPATVRATRIGYDGGTQQVTVDPGTPTVANFSLSPVAVSLDAVVVTATGEQKKREIANAVSVVNADQVVERAPITDVSQLLTGRAAGVNILQSSGSAGTNARIRIRGANSVSLSNDPIIFIDGVRLSNDPNPFTIGVGGQEASPISSLNPEEIESIEVIKGPSAATLYGTDAANGVIRITTKRGATGDPRWNVYVEQGRITEPNEYPLNYRGRTAEDANCFLYNVARNRCTQAVLLGYQPLEEPGVTPFSDGYRSQYGVSVAGGGEDVNYFVSGEFEDETGPYELPDSAQRAIRAAGGEIPDTRLRPSTFERISLRANVGARVAEGLTLNLSSGYAVTETVLPQNDNNAAGTLPSGLLGSYRPNARFGYGFLLPSEVFAIESMAEANRFTGSANLIWNPVQARWFTGRATVGLDQTARHDSDFGPVGEVPSDAQSLLGFRDSNRLSIQGITADLGGTAQFGLSESITSRTSVGMQYNRDAWYATYASGQVLGPGSKTVSSAAEQTADEETVESATLGTFVEQQFGWNDRLFVTGAVRADDHSAFGQEFDLIIYPKLGASYVVVDDQGEPLFNALNSLRLRAAWGAAGRAPGATDAVRFFEPATATLAGSDAPAVVFDPTSGLGNPDLRPERSEEVELGFDAGLLDGRLGLELTYYNKLTRDALIERTLPLSLGVPTERFENLGKVRNTGWEAVVNAELLALPQASWSLDLTGSINDNELEELGLGEDVDEILLTAEQRFREGYPLGGFFAVPLEFADADGDGLIDLNEYTIGDDYEFIGSALPTRELSIANTVTLFNTVRVYGLLDYRGGFYQYNLTEEFRCYFAICRGLNDPSASLFEQARALQAFAEATPSIAPFIEDASFWKLREVSFTLLIPSRWTERFGAGNASLSLSGRNLATWSDYTGIDPEVLGDADQNFYQLDFLTQPPVRTWVLRLNLGF